MLKEFKAFVLRGNVVDLAVGVVIGAAFGAIVNSMVNDVFTPLLGLVNVPDFADRFISVGESKLFWGKFVNAIVSFLLIATVVFFFVVKPLNKLMGREEKKEEPPPAMRECPHCMTSIRTEATVCAACTRDVPAAPPPG